MQRRKCYCVCACEAWTETYLGVVCASWCVTHSVLVLIGMCVCVCGVCVYVGGCGATAQCVACGYGCGACVPVLCLHVMCVVLREVV